METKRMSTLADIQCGLVLNRREAKITETAYRQYKRLNLRSFQEDGHLNVNELDNFDSVKCLDEQFLTHPNDIIIRLFAPLEPILIREREAGFVIPSQLAVVRMKKDVPILPGYLRWYLSSRTVSDKLLLAEEVCAQRSIKIGDLSVLPVPLLPLRKQELIIQICEAGIQRENLYKELMKQEDVYMNGLLQKIIGGCEE